MAEFEASSCNNKNLVPASIVEVKINTNGIEKVFSFNGASAHDPNLVAEDAKESNTSFSYSGRHDHGELPVLLNSESNNSKSGNGNCFKTNQYLHLVGAIQEAKYSIDSYIVSDMKNQNESNVANADVKGRNDMSPEIPSEEMDTDPTDPSGDSEGSMPPKKINRVE